MTPYGRTGQSADDYHTPTSIYGIKCPFYLKEFYNFQNTCN